MKKEIGIGLAVATLIILSGVVLSKENKEVMEFHTSEEVDREFLIREKTTRQPVAEAIPPLLEDNEKEKVLLEESRQEDSVFLDEDICKASLSQKMREDLNTISVDYEVGGIFWLSYLNPGEDTVWEYRCRILDDGQVDWWNNAQFTWWSSLTGYVNPDFPQSGTWEEIKTTQYYLIDNNTLITKELYSDGSAATDSFSKEANEIINLEELESYQ